MGKLNILYLITTLELGGAQRDVLYMAKKLDKNEFNVLLITSAKGMLVNEAKEIEGIKLFLIPELQRKINPFRDFIAFFKIFRIIKKEKIDIIHTHSSKAGILGRWLAKLIGVPIILHTVHGWGFNDYQPNLIKKFFILLERLSARITTKLITVSKATMKEGLVNKIGKLSQYEVIYGGIEIGRFTDLKIDAEKECKALGLDPAKPIVGMVARLEAQKAPLDFIKVARDVSDEIPDTQFLLVGDGPLRPKVEFEIARLELSEKVVLAGWRFDIPAIMASLDIFVLTSLWEGLPRVFAEAVVTGKPIVATEVGGAREMVAEGVNGYLVQPKANGNMARKIVELLNDKEKMRKFGEEGDFFQPNFDIDISIAEVSRLYGNLVRGCAYA